MAKSSHDLVASQVDRDTMIAKHVLNIHRTAGNAPEQDDSDKKVRSPPACSSCQTTLASGQLCATEGQPERKCALNVRIDSCQYPYSVSHVWLCALLH